jgi:hypothetical protein
MSYAMLAFGAIRAGEDNLAGSRDRRSRGREHASNGVRLGFGLRIGARGGSGARRSGLRRLFSSTSTADAGRLRHYRRANAAFGLADADDALRPNRLRRHAVVVCLGAPDPWNRDRRTQRRRAFRLDGRSDRDADPGAALQLPSAAELFGRRVRFRQQVKCSGRVWRARLRAHASGDGDETGERGAVRDRPAPRDRLPQNGFEVADAEAPIIAQYVAEGFGFLAMKLLPDQGVKAMRPVRVTTTGASFSLPLRMAAIGTGVTVGITIWVVSDGRYEPQNFPFFHIDDSALIWDWSTSLSNYTTLRTQEETALEGKGWEIESSISLSQQVISNVILSGGGSFNNGSGGLTSSVSDPSEDYLPVTSDVSAEAGGDGGTEDASVVESAEEVRTEDVNALFAGIAPPNVRVTRIRSDIAHAAMNVDLVLQASADQSEVSNVRTVTHSVNETCPLYNGCNVVGTGSPTQATASEQGGCAATAQARANRSWAWAVAAGMIGLVVARGFRGRRRSRKG